MLQVTAMSRREVAPRDRVDRRQGCPRGNGNLGVDGAQETLLLQGTTDPGDSGVLETVVLHEKVVSR